MNHNITPKWIDTLGINEIFVFGCRNSGKHFDGASVYALKHFGAVMGQREGRQGQSYAIPTIGGTIGLKDIKRSVVTFTKYAKDHSHLHFYVTLIACGGACYKVYEIAPLFRNASKLSNVSLPIEFWQELDKGIMCEIKNKLSLLLETVIGLLHDLFGKLRFLRLKLLSPHKLYKELMVYRDSDTTYLNDQMFWVNLFDASLFKSWKSRYIVNDATKCAYMILDNKKRLFWVEDKDINWDSIKVLPNKVKQIVKRREAPYSLAVYEYHDGYAEIEWQISPDGSSYYLDKYYGGKITDEKDIRLYAIIDSNCCIVSRFDVRYK